MQLDTIAQLAPLTDGVIMFNSDAGKIVANIDHLLHLSSQS